MKLFRKNRSVLLLAGALFFSACDSKLDLAPEDTTVEEEVFQNANSATSALMDVYNKTYEANKSYAYTIGDFTTRNLVVTSDFSSAFVEGNADPKSSTISDIWANSYSAINVANVIIKVVPELGSYDEDLELQHIAEAKFLRAFNYLNLLKLYGDGALQQNMLGLGLPLQLTPYEGTKYDSGKALSRSTVGEVYLQIIKDLQEAIPNLLDEFLNDLETRGRATKGTAHALLARTYLYMGEYDKAEKETEFFTNNDTYTLNSDLQKVFPMGGGYDVPLDQEYIYGIPLTYNNGDHQYGTHYYFYYSKTNYYVSPELLALFTETDQRKADLIWKGSTTTIYNTSQLTTAKFNNSDSRDNIPMIRLPEMLLTRAEVLVRNSGKVQEAVDLLNQVARRADASQVAFVMNDFTDADDLLDRILLERRKELAFEGLYRYDVIRIGQKLQYPESDNGTTVYKDVPEGRYVLPIPKVEIDITKGSLEQNPGYL